MSQTARIAALLLLSTTAFAGEPPASVSKPKQALKKMPCSSPTSDLPTRGLPATGFTVWCTQNEVPHGTFRRFELVGSDWLMTREGAYTEALPSGTWRVWSQNGQLVQQVEWLPELAAYQHPIPASGRNQALERAVVVTHGHTTEEQLCPHRRKPDRPDTDALRGCRTYGKVVDDQGRTTFKAPGQQMLRCEPGQDLVVGEGSEVIHTVHGPLEVEPMFCTSGGAREGRFRGYAIGSGYTEPELDGAYQAGKPHGTWQGSRPSPWKLELQQGRATEASGTRDGNKWTVTAAPDFASAEMIENKSGVGRVAQGAARLDGGIDTSLALDRIGKWQTWHPNLKLASEGVYDDGKQAGEWRFYDDRGDLAAQGWFVGGKRDGDWTVWDSAGEQRTVHYIDGVSNEDRAREELALFMEDIESFITDQARAGSEQPKPAALCMNLKLLKEDVGEFPMQWAASRRCEERFPHDVDLEDACRHLVAGRCLE